MDIIKHLEYCDPSKYSGGVAVIGVGALGSAVALEIAKLGFRDIALFDADKVENHNLSNQVLYGPANIGELKVAAAAATIAQLTGTQVEPHQQAITRGKLRYSYVFCCVDSMAARKQIFQNAIHLNFTTQLFVEGRMSAKTGRGYIIDPRDNLQVKQYRDDPEVMYPDSEVMPELGRCGVTPSIGATAHILAGVLTWQFMVALQDAGKVGEVNFSIDPWHVQFRQFDRTA